MNLITTLDDERLKAGGIGGTDPNYLLRDSLRAALKEVEYQKELKDAAYKREDAALSRASATEAIVSRIDDVEGMAKVIYSLYSLQGMDNAKNAARAVSAWLKEG